MSSLPAPREKWQEETVYHDGDSFFSALLEALSSAQRTIDLETYIFLKDPLGDAVLKKLSERARAGIRVRLLLDGFGSSNWTALDTIALQKVGVEVRFFHPFPWQRKPYAIWRYLTPHRLLIGLSKLNRRNHRKTCVIDGETAFLGGMNVSGLELRSQAGNDAWRDTSVRVRGGAVVQLSRAFELAWTHTKRLGLTSEENVRLPVRGRLLRLNVTGRQRWSAYADLLWRISRARKRIWITNPYFVPDGALIRALRHSAHAGTDVRVLVPKKSDVWGMSWAVKAFYYALLRARVRVYEYGPSVLHAKTMIIDDWATVGSSNMNHRSLLHDLEVDVVLTQPESLKSIEERFVKDLARSTEIEPRRWSKRPRLERAMEQFALLFRKWI